MIVTERIVLFGSEGSFSRPVLERLLAAGVSVTAVVVPDYAIKHAALDIFPVHVQQPQYCSTLAGLAAARDIPLLRVRHMHDRHLACNIRRFAADILLVACFPYRIPATLWRLARTACWNLHPAMLPRYRGPAPVYWQLRNKERHGGVTLHEVTDRLDAGNIVAQKSFCMTEATSTECLETSVAAFGVDLFLGALKPWREGHRTTYPQDETLASYYPRAPGYARPVSRDWCGRTERFTAAIPRQTPAHSDGIGHLVC
jgi:methionyl-tRNA formyltransferase